MDGGNRSGRRVAGDGRPRKDGDRRPGIRVASQPASYFFNLVRLVGGGFQVPFVILGHVQWLIR